MILLILMACTGGPAVTRLDMGPGHHSIMCGTRIVDVQEAWITDGHLFVRHYGKDDHDGTGTNPWVTLEDCGEH